MTNVQDLKSQALLERISSLTSNYENTIADLRVALTLESNKAENFAKQLQEATAEYAIPDPVEYVGEEVVEGEVIE